MTTPATPLSNEFHPENLRQLKEFLGKHSQFFKVRQVDLLIEAANELPKLRKRIKNSLDRLDYGLHANDLMAAHDDMRQAIEALSPQPEVKP